MERKILLKFGAPILAISLLAACGTNDGQDPAENEEEAPLNQEDDNNNQNPAEEEDGGMNGNDNGNGNGNNGNGTGINDEDGNNMEEAPDDNLEGDQEKQGGQGNQ